MSTATKTEKEKLNEFPITLAGDEQWVKRGIFAKQISEQCQVKFGAKILKENVEKMLEALDDGKTELAGENPDEFHKTFAIVAEAYEKANGKLNEAKEEEQRVAAEAAAKEKAQDEADEKMFLSVKDETATFGDLLKNFDTGGAEMDRFVAKKGVETKTLLVALNSAAKMGDFTNWMKGDLVVALEDRGMTKVVTKLVESTGQPYSNFYMAGRTCRAVPPEKRKGASYSIYAQIANSKFSKTPEDDAKSRLTLIDRADKGEFTTQTVRGAIAAVQGKQPAAKLAPEDNPKYKFLAFDEGTGKINLTSGFPRELFDQGAIVLDPINMKTFTSFKAKPEARWVAVPEYVKPESEKEAKPAKPAKAKASK